MSETRCPVCFSRCEERENEFGYFFSCTVCGAWETVPTSGLDWRGERVGQYEHYPTRTADPAQIAAETKRYNEALTRAREDYNAAQVHPTEREADDGFLTPEFAFGWAATMRML